MHQGLSGWAASLPKLLFQLASLICSALNSGHKKAAAFLVNLRQSGVGQHAYCPMLTVGDKRHFLYADAYII